MLQVLVGGLRWRSASLVLMDHLLIVSAVFGAATVRLGAPRVGATAAWGLIWRSMFIAIVLQICLHYCDLYDVRRLKDRRDLITGLLQALGAATVVLALLYYWVPALVIGRGVFLISGILVVLFVAGWRLAFEWLSLRVGPTERLVIVGTGGAALDLAREIIDRRHDLGVEMVGFIEADDRARRSGLHAEVLGTTGDIPRIVAQQRVDRVVVSLADARGKLSMDELLEMKLNDGVRFDHLASVYEEFTGKIAVENLRPSWLIFSEGFRKSATSNAAMRALDVLLALVGLLLSWPIMILVALAVRLTSPGPALFNQNRVGRNGTLFVVNKFRSMRRDAEQGTGAVWSTAGDPRVTGVGRILRRTRLDELPQLWNILRGDMSFVGPRPERPEFVSELVQQIPFYGQRHVVRPGLTGWAQVRYSYGSTVEDALQKLQYDLYYIKHMSVAFNLFVIIETVKTVLMRRGS